MTQEQGPTPNIIAHFSITKLEKGESFIAFCNTCKKVIYKGGGKTRISARVMEDQIESHVAAFRLPHTVDIIYNGL